MAIVYANVLDSDRQTAASVVRNIRQSGVTGETLVTAVDALVADVRITSGNESPRDRTGYTYLLRHLGGGVTIPASLSRSGSYEIYVTAIPSHTYRDDGGTSHLDTAEGILAHELGHVYLMCYSVDLSGEIDLSNPVYSPHPSHARGAERRVACDEVRRLTNPIRSDLRIPEEGPDQTRHTV